MKRRDFLIGTGVARVAACAGVFAQTGARPLPVIPMTDLVGGIEGRIALNLKPGTHDFGTGA